MNNQKINQNIVVFGFSIITIGAAEYVNLPITLWFGLVMSIPASLSVLVTLWKYTKNYKKD
jgi:membrane protein implicated in regulation of membrane protease activity